MVEKKGEEGLENAYTPSPNRTLAVREEDGAFGYIANIYYVPEGGFYEWEDGRPPDGRETAGLASIGAIGD